MSLASENLPCTPLEAASQDGNVSYLEYWRKQQVAYPEQKEAGALRRFAVAGSVLVRDPEKFTGVPKGLPSAIKVNSASPTAEIIEAWDGALGPFNPLEGGDLLRGAATMLCLNQIGSLKDLPPVRVSNPKDVVEAFLDVADQLEIGHQRPSHALLVGAQMVHKAAWVEQRSSVIRHRDLLGVAEKLYGRLDDPSVPWGRDKFKAAGFRQDILSHLLSDELRQTIREGENPCQQRDKAVRLLRIGVNNLLRAAEFVRDSDNEVAKRVVSGEMSELFTSLVIRDNVLVRSPLAGARIEVRGAYAGEDEPCEPRNRKFDTSFDSVVDIVSANGEVVKAIPLQLKLGKGGETHPTPYHPAIKVVTLKAFGSEIMARTGRDLLRTYDHDEFNRIVAGLDLVLEPMAPILRPAMANSGR